MNFKFEVSPSDAKLIGLALQTMIEQSSALIQNLQGQVNAQQIQSPGPGTVTVQATPTDPVAAP